MTQGIITINLGGLMGLGVNCYLIKTDTGNLLIDTGYSTKRDKLLVGLNKVGCKPGNLKAIVITHGHGDHIGNCAYLRKMFGAKIIMHGGDSEIVEHEDTSIHGIGKIILGITSFLVRIGEIEHFIPDLYIEDGYDLSGEGINAKVIHIPGHSKGSIGILTSNGELFCGDIVMNMGKPRRHFIAVDSIAYNESMEKIRKNKITMIYPGHGKPFPMELLPK
jgi:glyoxylase-like metal-dependent hydrolase (beta-lactamase superfamily II)